MKLAIEAYLDKIGQNKCERFLKKVQIFKRLSFRYINGYSYYKVKKNFYTDFNTTEIVLNYPLTIFNSCLL